SDNARGARSNSRTGSMGAGDERHRRSNAGGRPLEADAAAHRQRSDQLAAGGIQAIAESTLSTNSAESASSPEVAPAGQARGGGERMDRTLVARPTSQHDGARASCGRARRA